MLYVMTRSGMYATGYVHLYVAGSRIYMGPTSHSVFEAGIWADAWRQGELNTKQSPPLVDTHTLIISGVYQLHTYA